jgi:hypothetical protein
MRIQTLASAEANSTPQFITLQGTATQPCPFTLEFDIVRNIFNSASANFRIYNLSPTTRTAILRDNLIGGSFQLIELYAGYGLDQTNLPLVFKGYCNFVNSSREGTNIITTIECIGFDYDNSYYDNTFAAGTSYQQMIAAAVGAFAGVSQGAVGTFAGTPPTGQSFSGFSIDVLNRLTNNGVFIDNNKVYCLNQNEVVPNPDLVTIDASTGLIGSPVRRVTEITLTMLFEPRLKIKQPLQVNSVVNSYLNNTTFQVFSFSHQGTISPAVCGDAITKVTLQSLTNPIIVNGT